MILPIIYLHLIYLHLNNANDSKASVIMDGINIEEVTPYQLKNKYEQLKSSLN